MISYQHALECIRNAVLSPLESEEIKTEHAVGRVCSHAVDSAVLVSPFINSAMDGFAVAAENLVSMPCTMPVVGSSVAGDQPAAHTAGCGAWEIMTGAPIPHGYDTVVKIEDVKVDEQDGYSKPKAITLSIPYARGVNVRYAGEDFKIGSPILKAGQIISPFHVKALAAVGISSIAAIKQPRVSIFSTGREIIDGGEIPLLPGQIRNSNGPYLMAELVRLGAQPRYAGTIRDEPEVFETLLQKERAHADVIISTGAVSAGRHDFIPDSLRACGAEIVFHKVAIRPGKPVLFARFPDGGVYIGLPGNPVSTAIGLRFFLVPLLNFLCARPLRVPLMAALSAAKRNDKDFRLFLKGRSFITDTGQIGVRLLDGQESFKIHPLLDADCWVIIPEHAGNVASGSLVEIMPLDGESLAFTQGI